MTNRRWKQLSDRIAGTAQVDNNQPPVIFFNASTRLEAVSQNAAYSFLASKSLTWQVYPWCILPAMQVSPVCAWQQS